MSWNQNIKRIIDVCVVIAGQSPEGKYYNKVGEGLPFYQGKKEFTTREIGEPTTWTTKTTKEAFKDDILMSVRAPVGPINIATQRICIGRGLAAIRASNKVNNDYLFYFLLKHESEIVGNVGAVFNSINKNQIGNIPIPIPPIQEQKQIVAILDKAFTVIDQAKANIEKNIVNAKELFQSKLNAIFSQKGEGWEEKTLGEDCIISMGQSPKGTSYNSEGVGTPLINGPVEFGREPFSKTIMSKWTTEPTKICEEGDLILCVRGSTTGRINIAGFEACIGRGVASIQYKKNQEWINFFIRCNQKNIYNLGTGSTFPNVSGKILSELKFSEPKSIEYQNGLIHTMKELEFGINRISLDYNKKLKDLEELKKSILQKAFSGELIQKEVEV